MDEQPCSGSRWIWLAPVLMSSAVTAADFFFAIESYSIVIAQVVVCVVGLRLCKCFFPLLVCLAVTCLVAPAIVLSLDHNELVTRLVGVAGLTLISAAALVNWDFWARANRSEPTSDSGPIEMMTGGDGLGIFASSPTRIQQTSAATNGGGEVEFSFDQTPPGEDQIQPVLNRLTQRGKFTAKQVRWIEEELHRFRDDQRAAFQAAALQPGDQVGHVVINVPLGRGGEATVYRGHDVLTKQPAAVKILNNLRISERFRREMEAVHQLAHPNIVTAYDVGEFRGLPYITMELLPGPDLCQRVRNEGPLAWPLAARYILQAGRGLAHAHGRGLLHRDVKPANIILGRSQQVKLADLGLVAHGGGLPRRKAWEHETQDGHLAGTLPYMAPEQARSLLKATEQSDIYGLGATWFFLVTGTSRLPGRTFSQQVKNLLVRRRFFELPESVMPSAMAQIYQRMVEYRPRDRYQSCDAILADLESALNHSGEASEAEAIEVLWVAPRHDQTISTIASLGQLNSSLTIHRVDTLHEGIQAYHDRPAHLVLMDLTSATDDEEASVASFRENAPNVPLVALTEQDEIGKKCMVAGANSFVPRRTQTTHLLERAIFVTLSQGRAS